MRIRSSFLGLLAASFLTVGAAHAGSIAGVGTVAAGGAAAGAFAAGTFSSGFSGSVNGTTGSGFQNSFNAANGSSAAFKSNGTTSSAFNVTPTTTGLTSSHTGAFNVSTIGNDANVTGAVNNFSETTFKGTQSQNTNFAGGFGAIEGAGFATAGLAAAQKGFNTSSFGAGF